MTGEKNRYSSVEKLWKLDGDEAVPCFIEEKIKRLSEMVQK
jgi:hypothetical protein